MHSAAVATSWDQKSRRQFLESAVYLPHREFTTGGVGDRFDIAEEETHESGREGFLEGFGVFVLAVGDHAEVDTHVGGEAGEHFLVDVG